MPHVPAHPSRRRVLVVSALFLIALLSILWLEVRYGPPDRPRVAPPTPPSTPTDGEDPWYLRGSLWLREEPVSP